MGFASIIKLLCFYALIVLLVPCESLAAQQACQSLTSSATSDDLDDKMKCLSNDLPIEQTIMPGSIAAILCDFRGLFYGAVGKVIIAFNIVMMGVYDIEP